MYFSRDMHTLFVCLIIYKYVGDKNFVLYTYIDSIFINTIFLYNGIVSYIGYTINVYTKYT